MIRFRGRTKKGVTLMEMIVVVGVIGIATFLTHIIINVLADIYVQKSYVSGQQEVQSVLYNMAKEVRNSRSIVFISSDTLILQSFNVRAGYRPDQVLNELNIGTVTYRYSANETPGYLKRTVEFAGVPQEKKLLVGMLNQPDTVNFIFGFFPPGELPPYEGVSIVLRLQTAFRKQTNRAYRIDVLKRSHAAL